MDIVAIRDRLNELPFVKGERRVLIGHMEQNVPADVESEGEAVAESGWITPDPSSGEEAFLKELSQQLEQRGLLLERGGRDGDALYAVQTLRREGRQDMSWMQDAVNWVARITTIGIGMLVPGLVGVWLDGRFGTRYWALVGFMFGAVIGVWQLYQIARSGREV